MAVQNKNKVKDHPVRSKAQRRKPQQSHSNSSSSQEEGAEETEQRVRKRHTHGPGPVGRAKSTHHKSSENQQGLLFNLGLTRASDLKAWSILLMAVLAGALHWGHLSTLFENDRHFSHLSTLEREMAFRTEMGLYYSYFKTVTEAPSYVSGLLMIMNDNVTEYPNVINTLKRFNLYPEVILAHWYRVYTKSMNLIGIETKTCWKVNRGEHLSPVYSCEGLGDPAYFYVTLIFILNGAMMSGFFIYGTYLSGSRIGGIITVLCYFFNHGECTRVMWTPPLRESFSYPFLVLQMFLLTYILRTPNISRRSLFALSLSTICFMLPWQFAQFVLLTQISSLFVIYVVGYIDSDKFLKILYTHMVSLAICFVLMFGNSMLLTSYYASSLVVICVIVLSKEVFLKLEANELVHWILQVLTWIISSVCLKAITSALLGVKDDAHISNLLKSKFTNYKDFDTLMYTCAAEFDFMEKETPWRYLKTLLLPVVLLVFFTISIRTLKDLVQASKHRTHVARGHKNESFQRDNSNNGELVYHALQLIAYAVLAILIMRLKLFLTPHMCIMASLICSKQLFWWIFNRVNFRLFIFSLLACMAIQGFTNLQNEWNIKGEFSNLPQEELLEWIQVHTKPNAVFAGAMPTMASIKLSTGRPIVNHPHYEDADLRLSQRDSASELTKYDSCHTFISEEKLAENKTAHRFFKAPPKIPVVFQVPDLVCDYIA
ncbi:probable C-mannosyltransferase DPY19L1 [Bombina bombina]|uniref:probable C-mannosyltransferase DPY19L1 n=1 Tax=Bombina bombina TaxID=8345 RepID=UPI00235A61B8|nr:probable C-mannosyltransferase DPY19L1 [Bombina bombina]